MKLLTFQEDAAQFIADGVGSLSALHPAHIKLIVLQGPTGCGKSVTMAGAINLLPNHTILVWSPATGQIHEQLYRSLCASVDKGRPVNMAADLSVGANSTLPPGQVIVAPWEGANRSDKEGNSINKLTKRDGEKKNLFDILRPVKNLVIMIDEAHIGKKGGDTSAARGLLRTIEEELGYRPVIVEVSATPILYKHEMEMAEKGAGVLLRQIEIIECVQAGLLRDSIVLNDGFAEALASMTEEERSTLNMETLLLDLALAKQVQLETMYAESGVSNIPLIGTNVPSGKEGEKHTERLLAHLARRGMTVENGQVAIYTSKVKTVDLASLSSPSSKVRVLIYKQAVSTGFDCPRLQILVGLRNITSAVFKIQNAGRYIRALGAKHYKNPMLNAAYFYSDVEDYSVIDKDSKFESMGITQRQVAQADNAILAILRSAYLPKGDFVRTNREVINTALVEEKLTAGLTRFRRNFAPFNDFERKKRKTKEGSTSLEKVLSGDHLEGVELQYSGAITETEFIQQITEYVKGKINLGNNQRAAERIVSRLTRLLKHVPGFTPSELPEGVKVMQYLADQCRSIKIEGEETNDNALALRTLVESIFVGENAPQPISTEKNKEGSTAPREGRRATFEGSWITPDVTMIDPASSTEVKGDIGARSIYKTKTDKKAFIFKATNPEIVFLDSLEKLRKSAEIRNYRWMKNGTSKFDYRIPVNAGDKVSDFYPDFIVLVERADGSNALVVAEVKSKHPEAFDKTFNLTRAKSEALVQVGERAGFAGAVVYPNDGEFRTFRMDDRDAVTLLELINAAPEFGTEQLPFLDPIDKVEDAELLDGIDMTWFFDLGLSTGANEVRKAA